MRGLSQTTLCGPNPLIGAAETIDVMLPAKQQVRADLICCSHKAEAERHRDQSFIGFKWFRDTFLVQAGFAWASEVSARQSALTLAIQDGLIRAEKRLTPQEPQFGTTAIRLNRADPRVQAYLGLPSPGNPLRPPVLPQREG